MTSLLSSLSSLLCSILAAVFTLISSKHKLLILPFSLQGFNCSSYQQEIVLTGEGKGE